MLTASEKGPSRGGLIRKMVGAFRVTPRSNFLPQPIAHF